MNPGDIDIHKRARRRQRAEEILKESDICEENKNLILEYIEYRTVESSLSLLRQEKIISNLLIIARFLGKDFRTVNKKDIERTVREVYNMPSNKRPGEKITNSTKNTYCKILKKFFVWLKKNDHPEETDWLKPPRCEIKKLRKQERLYWEDIEKLSKVATNKRDFLLPQLLFDSGARIEEIATLRRRDIELIRINGNEKNKKPIFAGKICIHVSKTETRSPMIFKCIPALIDWLDNMPIKNPDTPLFINLCKNHKSISYKQLRDVLVELKERSGLEKPVNPHHFRKSACSYCMDAGMGDAQIDTRFGWVVGSSVKKHYGFPDEAKANEKYLAVEGGIIEEEKPRDEAKPKICLWCDTMNPIGRDFCINPNCRLPLNPEQNIIDEKTRVREIVMEALQEILKEQDINKRFDELKTEK